MRFDDGPDQLGSIYVRLLWSDPTFWRKEVTPDKLLKQIGESLQREAGIKASRSDITILCKDIDEITTNQEIREALEKQFEFIALQESAVKTLRKAYDETQTVIISHRSA